MLISVGHHFIHLIPEYFLTVRSVPSLARYLDLGGVVLVDGKMYVHTEVG